MNGRQYWQRIAVSTMLALVVVMVGGASVYADEYDCTTGVTPPSTVDNLRAPPGHTCVLDGTHVEGAIQVEDNATLRAYDVRVDGNIQSEGGLLIDISDGSRVEGNVQADNVGRVNIHPGCFVGGSIQIKESGAAAIDGVEVDSDILFDTNDRPLIARNTTVGGNLQAFQNTGGVLIAYNTIDGNLQCNSNAPPPTGGGNVVHGSMEDQCAGFDRAPTSPPDMPYRTYLAPLRK